MNHFTSAVFLLFSALYVAGCSDSKRSSPIPPATGTTSTTAPEITSLRVLGWQGSRGVVGQPFVRQFPAAGGRLPYTWSVFSGSLPPGLTLASTGQLSGTPTQAGAFDYAYQVKDQSGSTSVATVTQNINATGTAQAFNVTAPTGIPTFIGTTFAFQPFIDGGTLPITWSYVVPPNIQVNPTTGALSGTLSTTGSFTAVGTATGSQGAPASPITFNFGVNLGGAGVTQPPVTVFDGTWDVTYIGPVRQTSTGTTVTLSGEMTLFTISNGVVSPSGSVSTALNTISDVTYQASSLGFPFSLGGSITSAGTASGTWAPLSGSGWTSAGSTTWTATRR